MKPLHPVYKSQIALLVSVLICVLINPSVVFTLKQGGVSNYGTVMPTLVIFSIGLWICAYYLFKTSSMLRKSIIKRILLVLSVSYILLAVSTYPYKLSQFYENIHLTVAFALALFQLVAAVWLAFNNRFDQISILSLGIMAASLIIGLLTVFQVVDQLFSSQFISAIGFGILLVHSIHKQEPSYKS